MSAVDVDEIKVNFMPINKEFFYTNGIANKNMEIIRLTIRQKIAKNFEKNPCEFDQILYTEKYPLDHLKWSRRGSAETLHVDANITTQIGERLCLIQF